jgi:hypothetical protein
LAEIGELAEQLEDGAIPNGLGRGLPLPERDLAQSGNTDRLAAPADVNPEYGALVAVLTVERLCVLHGTMKGLQIGIARAGIVLPAMHIHDDDAARMRDGPCRRYGVVELGPIE